MSQISFHDLFSDEVLEENKPETSITIPSSLSPIEEEVYSLLQSGETSALHICEELVKAGKLPTGRFSTNKPKTYPIVCTTLESIVQQGKIIFLRIKINKKDHL